MKKIVLSLAGVLAATAFAPEASAIPAFARQVGMACQACHFQHFPNLNAFGRAFKASGFTMMGAQGKVEGEHLSIPNTLNMNILVTAGYNSLSNQPAGTPNGSYFTPNGGGELSLFVGGRVSEFAGFLAELAGTIGTSPAKLAMLWEVGGARVGLVTVTNNTAAYSFELLNTGAVNTHRLMGNVGSVNTVSGGKGNHINVTSAAQYLGTGSLKGNGVSFVASGDMGFVNIGKYNLGGLPGAVPSNDFGTTYVRAAYLFNAGGWDSAVGIQSFSGSQKTLGVSGADTKATIIDGQMQGEMGGMPVGLYASYGRAPASAAGNWFGQVVAGAPTLAGTDKKSFNIAGELGVIPHKATVQLAFRSGKTGAVAGTPDKDNAVMIAGTYELAQNVELSLTHTANSGSAYNAGAVTGKTQTTFLLETLF